MAEATEDEWAAFDANMERWEGEMWAEAERLVEQLGQHQAEAEVQRRIAGAAETDLFHLHALAKSIARLRTSPSPFKTRH